MLAAVRLRLYYILVLGLSLLQHSDAYTYFVQHRMREKIIAMEKGLVIDALAKSKEIEDLKLKESKTTAYRQGEIAYHARRKWALMLKIYFKCVANVDKMTHTEVIQDLTRLQRLDMDIYHATENMNQLEDDGMDVPPPESRRRSGAGGGTGGGRGSHMRQYLASADAALREKVRKRSDLIRSAYQATNRPVIDIQRELQFLEKNESMVLLPKMYTGKVSDYDPEFALPFLY